MIPATHWHDNDDGTAWVVAIIPGWGNGRPDGGWVKADRPCDTCGGRILLYEQAGNGDIPRCPACDGTGRHTFTVEVETGFEHIPGRDIEGVVIGGTRVYYDTQRVHVIDVLPIVADFTTAGRAAIVVVSPVMIYQHGPRHHDGLGQSWPITLPPAARPGMWAIRLQIHEPENVEEPMADERRFSNLDERIDISKIDDVWRDGYEAGFDACLLIVREETDKKHPTPEIVEEPCVCLGTGLQVTTSPDGREVYHGPGLCPNCKGAGRMPENVEES